MQLGFQTIPELNAQVLETYIGVIIQNTRVCTGACLAPAAQHWDEWGLGPTPHGPPAAGLAPAAPGAPQPPRTQLLQRRRLYICNEMRMYAEII